MLPHNHEIFKPSPYVFILDKKVVGATDQQSLVKGDIVTLPRKDGEFKIDIANTKDKIYYIKPYDRAKEQLEMNKKMLAGAPMNNKQVYKVCMAMNTMVTALGMQAENMQRQMNGQSMAYTEKDFEWLIRENRMSQNDIVSDLLP